MSFPETPMTAEEIFDLAACNPKDYTNVEAARRYIADQFTGSSDPSNNRR